MNTMKWYEDPTYIKMADCPEIQEQHTSWDKHDFYVFADGKNESPYHGIWLPDQSQLQAMCWELTGTKWEPYFALTMIRDFADENRHGPTMEQLWLAFVMHELHNKVWTGECWK